nr:DUF1284 domain-containing protein [Lachnospiraceae bacterium]
ELTYKEFIETVKVKIIEAGIRKDICGDCTWNDICRN